MKFDKRTDMSTHLLKFEDVVREVQAAGEIVKEQDKLSYLCLTLPKSYDPVTSVLEYVPNLSFELLSEKTEQKDHEEYDVAGSSAAYLTKFSKKPVISY